MAALYRFGKCLGKNIQLLEHNRKISLSATTYLKKIITKQEGNTLTFEGIVMPDKNDDRVLKSKNGACLVCSSGLNIKHTDVLILSQFVRPDGCMLPRRITGLCGIQQKRIGTMVAMAQRAGLMKRAPSTPIAVRRYTFNSYYDEETIKEKYVL